MSPTPKNQNLICNACGQEFALRKDLNKHYIDSHALSHPYQCQLCPKAFREIGLLNLHIPKHTGKFSFKCEFCGKGFVQKGELTKHEIRVHSDNPVQCQLCQKTFQAHILKSHMRRHIGEKAFSCEECGKAFVESGDLIKHKKSVHEKVKYECDQCGKRFSQPDTLKTHIKITHEGYVPFNCEFCGKSFTRRKYYTDHLLSVHKHLNPELDFKRKPMKS